MPSSEPQVPTPPMIGLQKVAPVKQVQQIPDITPMRRGRPTAPVQAPPHASSTVHRNVLASANPSHVKKKSESRSSPPSPSSFASPSWRRSACCGVIGPLEQPVEVVVRSRPRSAATRWRLRNRARTLLLRRCVGRLEKVECSRQAAFPSL